MEIDILRGFAIILMVLGHSFIVYPIDISGVPWCAALHNWIYSFHMELFFMLAGCVYSCRNFKEYLKKKTMRIFVPYIAFSLIGFVVKKIGDSFVHNSVDTFNLIDLFFYGSGSWFLYTLFIIFLVYPIIEIICNRLWKEIVLLGAILILQLYVSFPAFLDLGHVMYQLPYFIIGHMITRYIPQIRSSSQIRIKIAVFIIGVSCGIIFLKFDVGGNRLLSYIRAICWIIACYLPAEWFVRISGNNNAFSMVKLLLQNCSKYSLQIFLFNGYVLTVVRTILCNILHINFPIIIVFANVICNLAVTLPLCIYILSRVKILSFICGIPIKSSYEKNKFAN